MTKKLSVTVPRHLIGENYEMPYSPPFGAKEERKHVENLRNARDAVIDLLPYKVGQNVEVDNEETSEGLLIGVIINSGPDDNMFTYIYSYVVSENGKEKVKKDNFTEELASEFVTEEYAEAIAHYMSERHKFTILYSFAVRKIAGKHYKQCHRGMGFDDLCQVGFCAVANVADKWPPFLGSKDKGHRILSTINRSVENAMRRFLDDNNRTIGIPTYKLEELTVRIKADNILYGKPKAKSKGLCEKKCGSCEDIHGSNCRRNKPGKFERGIQNLLISIYDLKGSDEEVWDGLVDVVQDIDNMSLRDFAAQTGKYREVAEAVNMDVESVMSILEPVTSIDISAEDGGSIADIIEDNKQDYSSSVYAREVLEEAIKHIPDRNGEILKDHYFNDMSFREIAKKYGFSSVRASELVNKAISQMKNNKISMNILTHKLVGIKDKK